MFVSIGSGKNIARGVQDQHAQRGVVKELNVRVGHAQHGRPPPPRASGDPQRRPVASWRISCSAARSPSAGATPGSTRRDHPVAIPTGSHVCSSFTLGRCRKTSPVVMRKGVLLRRVADSTECLPPRARRVAGRASRRGRNSPLRVVRRSAMTTSLCRRGAVAHAADRPRLQVNAGSLAASSRPRRPRSSRSAPRQVQALGHASRRAGSRVRPSRWSPSHPATSRP